MLKFAGFEIKSRESALSRVYIFKPGRHFNIPHSGYNMIPQVRYNTPDKPDSGMGFSLTRRYSNLIQCSDTDKTILPVKWKIKTS